MFKVTKKLITVEVPLEFKGPEVLNEECFTTGYYLLSLIPR